MPKGMGYGGSNKNKGKGGGNSANRAKTGSMKPRNYDPKNTGASGGKAPKVTRMYRPEGNDTPSAPGK